MMATSTMSSSKSENSNVNPPASHIPELIDLTASPSLRPTELSEDADADPDADLKLALALQAQFDAEGSDSSHTATPGPSDLQEDVLAQIDSDSDGERENYGESDDSEGVDEDDPDFIALKLQDQSDVDIVDEEMDKYFSGQPTSLPKRDSINGPNISANRDVIDLTSLESPRQRSYEPEHAAHRPVDGEPHPSLTKVIPSPTQEDSLRDYLQASLLRRCGGCSKVSRGAKLDSEVDAVGWLKEGTPNGLIRCRACDTLVCGGCGAISNVHKGKAKEQAGESIWHCDDGRFFALQILLTYYEKHQIESSLERKQRAERQSSLKRKQTVNHSNREKSPRYSSGYEHDGSWIPDDIDWDSLNATDMGVWIDSQGPAPASKSPLQHPWMQPYMEMMKSMPQKGPPHSLKSKPTKPHDPKPFPSAPDAKIGEVLDEYDAPPFMEVPPFMKLTSGTPIRSDFQAKSPSVRLPQPSPVTSKSPAKAPVGTKSQESSLKQDSDIIRRGEKPDEKWSRNPSSGPSLAPLSPETSLLHSKELFIKSFLSQMHPNTPQGPIPQTTAPLSVSGTHHPHPPGPHIPEFGPYPMPTSGRVRPSNGTGYGGYDFEPSRHNRASRQKGLAEEDDNQIDRADDDKTMEKILGMLIIVLPDMRHETVFDIDPPKLLVPMLTVCDLVHKSAELLRNDSVGDITQRPALYHRVLDLIDLLAKHYVLLDVVDSARKSYPQGLQSFCARNTEHEQPHGEIVASIQVCMKNLATQARAFVQRAAASKDAFLEDDAQDMLLLCTRTVEVADLVSARTFSPVAEQVKRLSSAPQDQWTEFHQKSSVSDVEDDLILKGYVFKDQALCLKSSRTGRMKRLVEETVTLQTSLPSGIFVRYAMSRPDILKVLIIGPSDTPYDRGIFEFDAFCPEDYPASPPRFQFRTTGGGRAGFNPNLYPCGKGMRFLAQCATESVSLFICYKAS